MTIDELKEENDGLKDHVKKYKQDNHILQKEKGLLQNDYDDLKEENVILGKIVETCPKSFVPVAPGQLFKYLLH